MKKDFLHITDFSKDEIVDFIDKTKWIKAKFKSREPYYPFKDELPYGYELEKAPLESSSGATELK